MPLPQVKQALKQHFSFTVDCYLNQGDSYISLFNSLSLCPIKRPLLQVISHWGLRVHFLCVCVFRESWLTPPRRRWRPRHRRWLASRWTVLLITFLLTHTSPSKSHRWRDQSSESAIIHASREWWEGKKCVFLHYNLWNLWNSAPMWCHKGSWYLPRNSLSPRPTVIIIWDLNFWFLGFF